VEKLNNRASHIEEAQTQGVVFKEESPSTCIRHHTHVERPQKIIAFEASTFHETRHHVGTITGVQNVFGKKGC
jgi:hypothetical protein